MKITLENGHVLEGTLDEIKDFLDEMDSREPKYNSKSMGRIKIKDMDTSHLKNAILVKVRDWEKSLHNVSDNGEFVGIIEHGFWEDCDEETDNLLNELNSRQ